MMPDFTLRATAKSSSAQLFRLHGLGRVIRLRHGDGQIFLSVIRFMVWQFATINFFKTGKLQKELSDIANANAGVVGPDR
jgi:hypothetical protein